MNWKLFMPAMALIATIACNHAHKTPSHNGEDDHQHEYEHEDMHADEYLFTKEQASKVRFEVSKARYTKLGGVVKTTGILRSAMHDEIIISANTDGFVKFNREFYPGSVVGKTESLCVISGKNLSNNNIGLKYREAEVNFEKTGKDFERSEKLYQEKLISEKDYLNVKGEYLNAKIIFENLDRQYSDQGQIVSSAIEGMVKSIQVENGSYVESGDAIMTIAQNKRYVLEAHVQQQYLHYLQKLNTANIADPATGEKFNLKDLNGKIASVGQAVNENNYLIPVTLEFDANKHFLPGNIVDLWLVSDADAEKLTIPLSALMEEQGVYYVFRRHTDEIFDKLVVETGVNDGFNVEVKKGISAGDLIVTEGAVMIKLAKATGGLDPHSGHVH